MAIRMGGTLNIATSSSGDTTLITAANITDYGSRAHLQIMWYDVTSNDVVTITFKDTDGTTVIPAIYATRAAAGGIVVPKPAHAGGVYDLAIGKGLVINLSGAVAVSGQVGYSIKAADNDVVV